MYTCIVLWLGVWYVRVVVNVYLKYEFIIYYVVCVFFQSLNEYVTFKIALENYNLIDKVVLENK